MFAFMKTPYGNGPKKTLKKDSPRSIEQLGEQVEEVELFPSAVEAWEWHQTIMGAEMAANLEREWDKGRDALSEQLRAQIERGREVRAIDYQRALSRIAPIHESFVELFEQRYDAILTPAAPSAAPKGLASHRRSVILHLVDAVRHALDQLAALAKRQRPAHRRELVGPRDGDARLLRTARWLAAKAS